MQQKQQQGLLNLHAKDANTTKGMSTEEANALAEEAKKRNEAEGKKTEKIQVALVRENPKKRQKYQTNWKYLT